MRLLLPLAVCLAVTAGLHGQGRVSPAEQAEMDRQNAALRALLESGPRAPFAPEPLPVQPPTPGWALGMVSWIAAGRDDVIYLLQRGDQADPIVAVDERGRVLRSWGRGMFTTPHAIRVDPEGNIWTTDAASSMVFKFSPDGRVLMQIEVGGQPSPCNRFCSTTDIAFAPDGHLLISDGYRNARIIEYSPHGTKLREWGRPGVGPGEFRLPHSLQIAPDGTIYVADRENGRIQRFDRDGRYLGAWTQYGKTFGLALDGDTLWLSTIPRGPNSAPGWLIAVDRHTGELRGSVGSQGNHGMAVLPGGDLLHAPGPELIPQIYRRSRATP